MEIGSPVEELFKVRKSLQYNKNAVAHQTAVGQVLQMQEEFISAQTLTEILNEWDQAL